MTPELWYQGPHNRLSTELCEGRTPKVKMGNSLVQLGIGESFYAAVMGMTNSMCLYSKQNSLDSFFSIITISYIDSHQSIPPEKAPACSSNSHTMASVTISQITKQYLFGLWELTIKPEEIACKRGGEFLHADSNPEGIGTYPA